MNCVLSDYFGVTSGDLIPSALKEVVVNGGATIPQYAFLHCKSLISIILPESITELKTNTFWGCSSLESITIPFVGERKDGNDNTNFGYIFGASTYADNSKYVPQSLKAVIITGGTNIAPYAFYGCGSLTSITLPNSVTSIGYYAFYDCSSLTSISIPNGVTNIGSSAFSYCSSLTSITIPDSVTYISSSAFEGCSSLTSITIPDSVTSIGSSAFEGCSSLTIYCKVASKPNDWNNSWNSSKCPVVWDCKNNDKDENGYAYSVIGGIRYSLKDVVATVIKQPYNLSGNITISSSVTYKGASYSVMSIDNSAFDGCRSLIGLTIPDSVTSIGYSAFSYCSSLTSITLGNSVTSIGSLAFLGCGGLTSITIPNSVTSIAYWAFRSCRSLTSITLGNSVTSIDDSAFQGCSSLTKIYYKGTQADFRKISIYGSNTDFINATVYYYSETEPVEDGNYWHYDTDGVTPVVWKKES